jgi:hypothetical protein
MKSFRILSFAERPMQIPCQGLAASLAARVEVQRKKRVRIPEKTCPRASLDPRGFRGMSLAASRCFKSAREKEFIDGRHDQ